MASIQIDPKNSESARRKALYSGDTIMLAPTSASAALCELAWALITEEFDPIDPARAQFELPVERFVEIVSTLKPKFTHHPDAKKLLRNLFEEVGCDPEQTYFDVPKLRIATCGGYLTSGIGYAYKSHRDTWYACPPCQVNWWLPIREVNGKNAMVIHPKFFDQPVANNSADFDVYEWNANGRKNAANYVTSDPRPHPHLQETIDLDWQALVGRPGSMMLFSAQHLHGTIPNDSGETRFSIDFRTVNRHDIENHIGADVIDSAATGTTLRDFMRSTDLERFTDGIVATYESCSPPKDGVLVFDPNAA